MVMPWTLEDDTEDVQSCCIVAERKLLQELERRCNDDVNAIKIPEGKDIQLLYQEALRIDGSDQLRYSEQQCIQAEQLIEDQTNVTRDTPSQLIGEERDNWDRGKRSLRIADVVDKYAYTFLHDLHSGFAHVYGVVVNMKIPRKSSGKDFYMHMQIIDESCPHKSDALLVLVFYRTMEQMPKILYAGDVVRFHKLKIQQHEGQVQAVCFVATRYLVIRENASGKLEKQSAYEQYTFESSDEHRVKELIQWSKSSLQNDCTLPPKCASPPTLLEHITRQHEFVDIAVRVLHIEMPYDGQPHITLLVHDRSGSVKNTNQQARNRVFTSKIEMPTAGVVKILTINSRWETLLLFGFTEKLTSDWCRFRNLFVTESETKDGDYDLHFREDSSLILLPEYDIDVQLRLGGFKTPEAKEQRIVEINTKIPSHVMKSIPITALKDVLQSECVPQKYHCHVQVVNFYPQEIHEIVKYRSSQNDFVYAFTLRLQDDSGSLNAIVYGLNAKQFLMGIPACDLKIHALSRQLISKYLHALLNPLKKIHCCLKSYRPNAEEESKSIIRYQLFDTILYKQTQGN